MDQVETEPTRDVHQVVVGPFILLVKSKELAELIGAAILEDQESVVVDPNVVRVQEIPASKPDARSFGWAFTLGAKALRASSDDEMDDLIEYDFSVHKPKMLAVMRQVRNELLKHGPEKPRIWLPGGKA